MSERPGDREPATLRDPSMVGFKIFTLDNRILQRRIGQLSEDDIRGCAAALDTVFRT